MPISVGEQAYIFLCSLAGGMLIAFIYDLFRIKRKAMRTRSIVIHIEDFLYWVIIAIVMIAVVYYSNQGEIRGFIFIATLMGVFLYTFLLSKVIIASSMLIIRAVTRAILIIWKVVTYPLRFLLKLLMVPAKFTVRGCAKGCRKVRQIGRNRFAKVAIWRRVFRNYRKKI